MFSWCCCYWAGPVSRIPGKCTNDSEICIPSLTPFTRIIPHSLYLRKYSSSHVLCHVLMPPAPPKYCRHRKAVRLLPAYHLSPTDRSRASDSYSNCLVAVLNNRRLPSSKSGSSSSQGTSANTQSFRLPTNSQSGQIRVEVLRQSDMDHEMLDITVRRAFGCSSCHRTLTCRAV